MTDKHNGWLTGDWEDIPTTNPDDPKAERQETEKDTDEEKE